MAEDGWQSLWRAVGDGVAVGVVAKRFTQGRFLSGGREGGVFRGGWFALVWLGWKREERRDGLGYWLGGWSA